MSSPLFHPGRAYWLLGLCAAGLSGCTAERRVGIGPDPSRAIVTVVVTPSAVAVPVDSTVQLLVYGINAAGDSVALRPNWTANGGTLGADGTFGSDVPGTFTVIAASPQFPYPADTAIVTVTGSPLAMVDVEVQPFSPIIAPGEARPFLAFGVFSDSSRAPIAVTWSATGGTITGAGVYTAGSTLGTFQVIATSTTAPLADTVPVTISNSAPTVQTVLLLPDSIRLDPGKNVTFTAFALYTDGTVAPVLASYGATAGTIAQNGFYTAPQTPGNYLVTATHGLTGKADTSKVVVSGAAVVAVTLSPATASLVTGGTQLFSVLGRLSDGTTAPVSVNFTATGGSITPSGLYTAGQVPGTYRVVATTPDLQHADTSIVTLNLPSATLTRILLSPDSVSILAGSTQQFTAVGLLSDGTTAPVSVAYSATGGTVTSGGLFTAPQTAGSYLVVARSTTANLADTSRVTVNQPTTLTGITVAPSSVQLLVGGIQQFTATGRLSNGGTTAVSVTWFTTDPGGSVTSTGQYRGGTSPGTYLVVARQVGGSFADTAQVTLSALPPAGSNACSNEPPGLTLIFDAAWNAVPPQAPATDADGWTTIGGRGRLSIVQDPSAPKSPQNVAAGKFPAGSPGGSAPFRFDRYFGRNVTTQYMCIFTMLDPAFTNNGNVGTKFGFLLTPYQGGSTGLNHYLNLTDRLGVNLQSVGGTMNPKMFSNFSLINNRGRWVKVEVLIIANTLGNADGVARMWVNDAQVLNVTNVQYFFPSSAPAFNGVTWNPTYGGGLNPVPYDMFQFVDHWRLSGK